MGILQRFLVPLKIRRHKESEVIEILCRNRQGNGWNNDISCQVYCQYWKCCYHLKIIENSVYKYMRRLFKI